MNIKKLTLHNIRSYSTEEIIFPEGSILLCGDIGSGKTSLLLAIEYALFGLQPGQRGTALLSNGKNTGKVILEFEINGKEIVIERSLKRNARSVSQDYAAITIENQKIESSVTEIKAKVLELLDYPQEFIKKNNLLYRYTVYTPQEEMKQIILEDAESRLNILRHIFGMDKYKKIKENLSFLTFKLREESKILQFEIRDLDTRKEKLDSIKELVNILKEKTEYKKTELDKLLINRKSIEEEKTEIEKKVREKEIFEKEIEKTNIMLISKKDQISKEEKDIEDLEKKLFQSKEVFNEETLLKIIEEIGNNKLNIETLNKNYIEISGKINSLDIKKSEDLQKKNRIFKIDFCPTCLQDVSETHKHNILNETENQLKKAEREQKELKAGADKITKLLENERSLLENMENEKTKLEVSKVRTQELEFTKQKISTLKKSREDLSKDINFLEKHIQNLKQSALEFTKFDNLLRVKEEELKGITLKERNNEIELAELKKELELTRKEISELEKKIEETEKTREKLTRVLELEKWLSEDFLNLVNFTEKSIMLTLRNEFSKLFNDWFSVLTTDSFYVRLDENFTPIISQGDFELDYSYLSGGERTAVALAYRLALNQILNSILSKIKTQGLVILDEPTDGFSDQQLNKVRDVLQELDVSQLILVSHEPKIEGFVDNVIRLKKEGGVSRKE